MPNASRNNKQYQDLSKALKRKAKKLNLPCWICGHTINYDLDWRDPMSYTYDHDIAIANGGDMRGPGKPSHRACNSRRQAGNTIKPAPQPKTSRDW